MSINRNIIWLLKIVIVLLVLIQDLKAQQASSVLERGTWLKYVVQNRGVYRITAASLAAAGIDLNTINPDKIGVYSNDGGPKPQLNMTPRTSDLKELPIQLIGTTDGRFDGDDYLFVFATGPDSVYFDNDTAMFKVESNIYARESHLYLTVDQSANGLRMGNQEAPTGNTTSTTNQYITLIHQEENIEKPFPSGRQYYGHRFSKSGASSAQYSVDFEHPAIGQGQIKGQISAVAAGHEKEEPNLEISYNDVPLEGIKFGSLNEGTYERKGILKSKAYSFSTAGHENKTKSTFKFDFRISNANASGYLDAITFNLPTKFNSRPNTAEIMHFAPAQTAEILWFNFETEIPTYLWDVTNRYNAKNLPITTEAGTQGFKINRIAGVTTQLVAFGKDVPEAKYENRVNNQNLHGETTPTFLLIAPKALIAVAEKLAIHRISFDGMHAHVTALESIYNEFSGGSQDLSAIRDYIKYHYDKGNGTLQYVLLVGDGSYSYLNQVESTGIFANTNQIPIYESRESLHPLDSYASDDFFAFMETEEGNWDESVKGDHTLDLGIGRLPINTVEEGMAVVDKIIHYQTSSRTLGAWRNEIYLTADDEDKGLHMRDAETMTSIIQGFKNSFHVNKLYLDDFEQTTGSSHETSTAFAAAVETAFEKGGLILNYTGHGREDKLAEETMLDLESIDKLRNLDRLPLMVTATCQFGRIDDPARLEKKSGAEAILLNPNGGAIALLTTGRPVFSDSNLRLNSAFYEQVFKQENGEYLRLGDIFRLTKNASTQGVRNRNFILLGDPSMRLNYPKNNIKIDQINDMPLNEDINEVKALQAITLKGSIVNNNGTKKSNFTGVMIATLYDQEISLQTRGFNEDPFSYKSFSSILFTGKVSVTGGDFAIKFTLSKNINYQNGNLKLLMYAQSTDNEDASGNELTLSVSGTENTAKIDNKPPEISLFVEKQGNTGGQPVSQNVNLLVDLYDENGISLTRDTDIGGILAVIDEGDRINLNSFYTSEIDDFTKGKVTYPLKDLSPGNHRVTVEVRDTWNNVNKQSITFRVGDASEGLIRRHGVYPNPVIDKAKFIIEHGRIGDDIIVLLKVMDSQGRVVYEAKEEELASDGVLDGLTWEKSNLTTRGGIYFYEITIINESTNNSERLHNKFLLNY